MGLRETSYHIAQLISKPGFSAPAEKSALHATKSVKNWHDGMITDMQKLALKAKRR